jgi:FO synthase subunit 2
VKVGHKLATLTLLAGCNDMGGTLMEESISREAGADAGEYTSVDELRAMIRSVGRIPRQRNTLYGLIDEPEHEIGDVANQGYAASGWSGSS